MALAPTPKKSDASGAARTTSGLGAVLAEVLERPDVPPHANFFEELGADSLLMARFCARTRKRDDLPSVGMPDVYRNPTIASLTAALDGGADPDRVRSGPAGPPATESEEPTGPRATTAAFVLCGAAQLALRAGLQLHRRAHPHVGLPGGDGGDRGRGGVPRAPSSPGSSGS